MTRLRRESADHAKLEEQTNDPVALGLFTREEYFDLMTAMEDELRVDLEAAGGQCAPLVV